jgi:hypothetical protein
MRVVAICLFVGCSSPETAGEPTPETSVIGDDGLPIDSAMDAAPDTSTPSCGDLAAALPAWFNATPEKELYVSPSGADTNDGSKDKPLKTTAAAFAKLAPGVRLNFAEGTYGCGTIAGFNGTATKPGWVRSSDGPRKAKFACGGGGGVLLDKAHYVALEGLEISDVAGHGVQLSSGGSGPWDPATISNEVLMYKLFIHNTTFASFKGSQSKGVYAIENEVAYANPGRQNFEFVAVDDIVVAGNEAHHSGAFNEFKGGAKNGKIFRNYIHDVSPMAGIQTGILVGGDCTGKAYLVNTAAKHEAENLVVWGNVIVGGDHAAFRVVSCKDCVVANNTYVHPAKPGAFMRVLSSAFDCGPGATPTLNENVLVANNIFYAQTPPGYVIPSNQLPPDYITFKNNLWFGATADVSKSGSDIPFPGDYVDPMLDSSHKPKAGSAVIGKGVAVPGVPAGFEGKCWAGAPNIGAY